MHRFHARMGSCVYKSTKGAPLHEQKELRSSGKRRRRVLRMARVNCFTTDRHAYHKTAQQHKASQTRFANGAGELFHNLPARISQKPRSSTKRRRRVLRMARVNCFTTDRHAYHKNRAAAQSVADAFCEWLFREGDFYDRFSDS